MSSEAEKLRANAARLFAMAMEARDQGDNDAAEAFTVRAADYLERAKAAEARSGEAIPPPGPQAPQQQVTQQQQQLQPKKQK
jgi:hypothetical protein